MLEEVGPAGMLRAFVTGAGGDGHADGHGLQTGNRIADDADAVRQGVGSQGQDFSFRRSKAM